DPDQDGTGGDGPALQHLAGLRRADGRPADGSGRLFLHPQDRQHRRMISDTLYALLIALMAGTAVLLIVFSIPKLGSEVPGEDREYMDPLPPMLRLLWPVVRFIEYHICQFTPPDWLERTHKKLELTGVSYLISAEQFYAIRILSTVIAVGIFWL